MLFVAAGPHDAGRGIPASYSSSGDASGGAAGRGRILVVEDEYFVALDLEQRLLEAGFTVVGIAATAEEATEMAVAGKPDLAIMDIRLAGPRDGVDAAMHLLAELGVPSVFATATSDHRTRIRAEQAKPRGWLQKPYSTEMLIAVVTEALRLRSSR